MVFRLFSAPRALPILVVFTFLFVARSSNSQQSPELSPTAKAVAERADAERKFFAAAQAAKAGEAGQVERAIRYAREYSAASLWLLEAMQREPDAPKATVVKLREDVVAIEQWLAGALEGRREFAAARPSRIRVLRLLQQDLGDNHFRVTDARLALSHNDQIAKLSDDDYHRLAKATEKTHRALASLQQQNFEEAKRLYEEAIPVFTECLGRDHPEQGAMWGSLGALYDQLREYKRAGECIQEALRVRKSALGEQHPLYMDTLNLAARHELKRGNASLAEQHFRKSLELQRAARLQAQPRYPQTLDFLAILYRTQGDHARALPLLVESAEVNRVIFGDNHPDFAMSLNRLALAREDRGELDKAEALMLQAAKIIQHARGEAHPDYALCLNNLAGLNKAKGNFELAEGLCRQSLKIGKGTLGDKHPSYAGTLSILGSILLARGDLAGAEPVFQEAVRINQAALGKRDPEYARALNNLATFYQVSGDYARAKSLSKEASEIRKTALGAKHPDYAHSLQTLAVLDCASGDFTQAEPLFRESLAILLAAYGERHPTYATAVDNFGAFYQAQGDLARAEEMCLRALGLRKAILGERHAETTASLNRLALIYMAKGEYERALPYCRDAVEINRVILGDKHPDYANNLNSLALLYYLNDQNREAETTLRQVMAIHQATLSESHPIRLVALNNLATMHYALGDFEAAETLFQQVLEARKKILGGNHLEIARSYFSLARLRHARGNTKEAEPLSRQALEIAYQHLDQAALVQSERQQLRMGDSLRNFLNEYLSLAIELPEHRGAAYDALLRWKGIVWMRQQQLRAMADTPQLEPLVRELRSVATRLATAATSTPEPGQQEAWRRQLDDLSQRKEQLERDLSTQSVAYRHAKRQVTLQELNAALPEEAALVDFIEFHRSQKPAEPGELTSEVHLAAFVIRKDQPVELYDLGPVEPLAEAIDVWRRTFGRGEEGSRAALLLRDKLWSPFEAKLPEGGLVLVSPDGILGRLPLAALPGSKAGSYLLEKYALATLPAPQALPALLAGRTEADRSGTVLLVGGVEYEPLTNQPLQPTPPESKRAVRGAGWRKFDPLPGTAAEIAAVEKIYRAVFPQAQLGCTVLDKLAATQEQFVADAPRHRYLHLATHGYFAPAELLSALRPGRVSAELSRLGFSVGGGSDLVGHQPGLLSGLALAGANSDAATGGDGILTAEEVQTLDLRNVELATLSACETGLGEAAGGEGILGLQRAFQLAGARTTVTSLWMVDDAQTQALMERFYRNFWEKKMTKLAALREAQLWMLREGRPNLERDGQRGLVRVQPAGLKDQRLSPFYWAAFVLSGDWK